MNDVPQIGPQQQPGPSDDDEAIAALLRGALTREADRATPSVDGLQRIQREIRARQTRRGAAWLGRLTPALTAAAAVAVLVVAGAVAIRLADAPAPAPGPAHPDGSSAPIAIVPPPDKLPVYVVGHQGNLLRLFREFRTTRARDLNDRVSEAVTDAINLVPLDPDYDVRLFQGGQGGQAQADVTSDQITVHITSAMATHPGATRSQARLAVQQLVWTATATAGRADVPVRIVVENGEQTMFGRVSLVRDFGRETGANDPRAPVWIIGLPDESDWGHTPLQLEGDAVLGTGGRVTWTLTLDGAMVDHGTAFPTTAVGNRTKWWCAPRITKAGTYVVTVVLHPGPAADLPTVASGTWRDSKTFYVR